MRHAFIVTGLLLLSGCLGFAQDRVADAQKADAQKAADAWLPLLDAGQYGESWEKASSAFQSAVTKQQWSDQASAARTQTGKLKTRKFRESKYADNPPNSPAGKYVSVQYDAWFENVAPASEMVAMLMDKDGNWRVVGYFVKPSQ